MHHLDPVADPAVGQARPDRVVGGHLGVDEEADEPERQFGHSPQEMAQQQQRRLVDAVRVVDHQEQARWPETSFLNVSVTASKNR